MHDPLPWSTITPCVAAYPAYGSRRRYWALLHDRDAVAGAWTTLSAPELLRGLTRSFLHFLPP